MEEKPTEMHPEKSSFSHILGKFNIFRKEPKFQVIVLSFWIISITFLLSNLFYNAAFQELIKLGKFPQDASWMMWVAGISLVGGLIVLLVSPGITNIEEDILIEDSSYVETNFFQEMLSIYNQNEFSRVKEEIELYLETFSDELDKESTANLISLLQKTNIILLIRRNIQKILNYLQKKQLQPAFYEYNNTNGFINHHLLEIPEKIISEFDALFLELQNTSVNS